MEAIKHIKKDIIGSIIILIIMVIIKKKVILQMKIITKILILILDVLKTNYQKIKIQKNGHQITQKMKKVK